ncbi:MAG: NAD-dependent succinate-semialdehyde dehydrogenase [Hamadaea sp.]|nr:NAD-dependent succinate-semialdehyde dehydrogenase [Hamadaea sp.]
MNDASPPTFTPDLLDRLVSETGLWPDGRAAAATFPVFDPATEEVIATVADGGVEEAVAAVDSAARAFASWAQTSPRARSEILRRTFELMQAEAGDLAALIAWENGKAIGDARSEVAYAAEFFRWYAEEAVRSDGRFEQAPSGAARTVVLHRPVGVAALVTPWNFPAAMATRKIGPALAAGCTVVLKPARETPLTALAIARLLSRAGLPDGVLNVVPTSKSGVLVSTWLEDARVRKLSFTGSTEVGRTLLRQTADRIVNASMELGGNAPFIVTEDADVAAAVRGAMIAKFRNGGQACTAANRFYVHEAVAPAFIEQFGAAIQALRVGPASDPAHEIGPLINRTARNDVGALVDRAVAQGARISHWAAAPDRGCFYPPTLLIDVPPSAEILATEIFGPVAPIVTWESEPDLIAQVNDTELGLAAYLYAGDLGRARWLAQSIDAGMVGVNRGIVSDPSAPFGGVKQSGLGREGAREGLLEYQEAQYLSLDWPS